MVIQVDSEGSSKSTVQMQNKESKKYIVVKNHVREIPDKGVESSSEEHNIENVEKFEKPVKKHKRKTQQSSSSDDNNVNITEISKSDLKELKSVYEKCKTVLMNIESKYGHLLNLDKKTPNEGKRKHDTDEDDECSCALNRKIVFDDNGREVYDESHSLQNHICVKRLKNQMRHFPETYPNVTIEHHNCDYDNLPDSIQELTELLKNPSIMSRDRRSIIEKIRQLREDYLNMIRFERSSLIEKLKTNPEDIMDFKGTNISSLTGYPTK
ncbi:uncharacterized protein LOC125071296 [Vanessa atalanta]|uniref:uncharacterized protein LOC125071296 n=1 Tax=Vanessa atalanta TaxID=42275 RepID=UPI001FCD1E35|nr:uncharacterized protein LOC125071296 [Vanessa atalanta]